MGQRDIRPLLIIGAMTVVRWAVRKGAAKESWLDFRYLIDRNDISLWTLSIAN